MPVNPDEVARREAIARERIKAIHNTPGDEHGVTLFVSHHLNEIEASYWMERTGTARPEPGQVLDMLELRSHWGEDEEEEEDEEALDFFDFTLPGGVTQYVICVEFDDAGNVASVSMES